MNLSGCERFSADSPAIDISRRKFNTGFFACALGFFVPTDWLLSGKDRGSAKPEKKEPPVLSKANRSASLTNLSLLPKEVYNHQNTEAVNIVLGFGDCFDRSCPDFFNQGGVRRKKFFEGVREAIARGQATYIVVELPGKNDFDINTCHWTAYTRCIAQKFNGANFIIGNEVNINPRWGISLLEYTQYYLAAVKEIRNYGPLSHIFPYGEAYYGKGETLREVLGHLRNLSSEQGEPWQRLIDGLCLHYYDVSTNLPDRVRMYRQIAKENGLPPSLHLTELGKREKLELNDQQHSNLVTQNLAMALALFNDNELVAWHTAHSNKDLGKHSLTRYDKDDRLTAVPAFHRFWEISQLLHHGVELAYMDKGIVVVRGMSYFGKKTTIAWNSTPFEENPTNQVLSTELLLELGIQTDEVILEPSKIKGVEGPPIIITENNRR